jgi:hypothetical protein
MNPRLPTRFASGSRQDALGAACAVHLAALGR